MTRKEFLERRKEGLGGSDAAVVCGLSPWQTELELYLEKRGELNNSSVTEYLFWGSNNEDEIASTFAVALDLKVRRTSHLYRHPDHSFLIANLDRIIESDDTLLECKTANAFKASDWGTGIELELVEDPDTLDIRYAVKDPNWKEKIGEVAFDEVPEYYLCQVQHSLAASGRQAAYLAVLIGGNTFRVFYIQRDEAFIEALIELESAFWTRVLEGNAPTADYSHPSTEKLLKQRYTETTGEAVELGQRGLDLYNREAKLKARAKELETEIKAISNEIKDLIGNNAAGVLPDGTAYVRNWIAPKEIPATTRSGYFTVRHVKKAPALPVAETR